MFLSIPRRFEGEYRLKKTTLLVWLLALVLLGSCSLLPEEETFDAEPVIRSYEAQSYAMAYAERGDMTLSVRVSCTYVPVQQEKLCFAVSGELVDEVFVETGESVKKGQVLAQLQLGDVENRIESCQQRIDSIRLSQRQLEERWPLEEQRARLSAGPQGAEEAVKALTESYDRQRQSLSDSLYLLEVQLAEYRRQLADRQIVAGFDGTVTYVRSFQEGARSAIGERVITLSDSTLSLFRAETDQWPNFHEGDEFTIVVSKTEYEAVVTTEAALGLPESSKQEGKKAMVYLTLTQPALDLEENDRGTLTLILDTRTDALTLPEKAVSTLNGKSVVYYLDEEGIRRYREVETGLVAEGRVEILSGLNEGDCVIAG